ncbi:MAG: ADP-ribosylglycohydrolase family protein [Desulfohalobiaceae bacterium]
MLGAIAGDLVGSRFEARPTKNRDFELVTAQCRITDDSVLSLAVAQSLMDDIPYADNLKAFFRRYPQAGYGGNFMLWAASGESEPYYSFGNGSAMRVSTVGWYLNTEEDVLREAEQSAAVTHNHPEGIKGAQSVALAVFRARQARGKEAIKQEIEERFCYDLSRSLRDIRPGYSFDVTCQGSVPEALIAFLEAEDFEDTLRNAVSLGGDSDTQACIAGAVAEALYGDIPASLCEAVFQNLDAFQTDILERFLQQTQGKARPC